jgi:hypothetical protein
MVIAFPSEGTGMAVNEQLMASADEEVRVEVIDVNMVVGGWKKMRLDLNSVTCWNRTLTLIEREDDTRSWGNFLVYFSHSTTMSYPPRGWGYILICC